MRRRGEAKERELVRCHLLSAVALASVVLALMLLLSGCRTSKEVERRGHRAELQIGANTYLDSVVHPYTLHIVRQYDLPTGVLEREEVVQSGEVREVVRLVRDTLTITERDTLLVEREVLPPGSGRRGKSRWYRWVLLGVVLAIAVSMGIKMLRRYGRH